MSYLNEIISLNQLRSRSSSWRAWNIRRLAICESFIYLKFPPNLFFKSTFHLRTVYNKNVSVLILWHTLSATSCINLSAGNKGPQLQAITSSQSYSFLKKYQLLHFSLPCRDALLYTLSMKWTPATTIGYKVWMNL